MILEKVILEGSSILKKNGIKTSRLDSEILMSKAINKDRVFIILNSNQNLEKKSLNCFFDLIKKRSIGTPVSYLTGKKNFWNSEFQINKNVLIPRPDTELIIQEALKLTKNKNKLRVLDIGTGSGCLILTILKEKKNFSGIGIDISKKCLNLAKINRDNFALGNRVKFLKSDIDNFNYGKYDLIVSNPPYIKKFDLKYLEKDVYGYEPILALDGGVDGLFGIKKVISNSSKFIKKNGILIIEIAFDQTDKVKKILKENGYFIKDVVKDLAKNNRCLISIKK